MLPVFAVSFSFNLCSLILWHQRKRITAYSTVKSVFHQVNTHMHRNHMSRNQNAGQNHNIKIDNKSFERLEQFKYLGTTLTNRKSIHEEIRSRFKSENPCYHAVQNLLSPRLLSKNTKIRVYRTIILLLLYMDVKLGLSH
jgi:hypothetical protein